MREGLEALLAGLAAGQDAATLEAALPGVQVTASDDGTPESAVVTFAGGAGPALADLEAWFGTFGEPPRRSSGTRRLRGEWWREPMPVRVALYVVDPPPEGEPVPSLLVQRGTSRPG